MLNERVEPPEPLVLIALLEDRHDVPRGTLIEIESKTDEKKRFELKLDIIREEEKFRPREHYTLNIGYMVAHSNWDKLVDALDALFGMLVESDFDHRSIPVGADVEHQGTKFDVGVKYERPDLEAAADRMLNSN